MDNKQSSTTGMAKFGGRVALLVVVLVLVGSLLVVLNYARQRTTVTGSTTTRLTPTMSVKTKGTPTSTPAQSGSLGKTLYTTPPNSIGFSALSWSPDSKRVASVTNGVQIWDASTGKHLVTVQMSGTNEWPYGLDWSPNSQQVAVATNQHVLIVNGQTGQIVRTYAANTVAMTNTAPSGTSYLASLFPGSGGLGFRATAWSPDGNLMASALSFGVNGEAQVWHPQTGALAFNLKVSGSYNIGALSWSSDGQYIAASTWNTQGGNPNQPNSMVVVWKVSTHQIVFQHNDFMDSGASIVWQPQSYNLAFDGATSSGGNLVATLEIWNATTGKLVKQYIGTGFGGLDWSPDGKYLAYMGYGGEKAVNAVIIIDVTTGKQVYVYKEHHNHISVIDWSPDGRYIVSGEGNTQGNMVAKVWVAE